LAADSALVQPTLTLLASLFRPMDSASWSAYALGVCPAYDEKKAAAGVAMAQCARGVNARSRGVCELLTARAADG
jgi:hypothetical protein